MAIAAIEQLGAWEVSRVAAMLSDVTGALAARATTLGLQLLPAEQRGPHLLGVQLSDAMPAGVLQDLAAAGCFAAVRGDVLRIAPHVHVTDADVDRLMEALRRIVAPRR
jgi:selenocysteine lyase/cysteine desulfurase